MFYPNIEQFITIMKQFNNLTVAFLSREAIYKRGPGQQVIDAKKVAVIMLRCSF